MSKFVTDKQLELLYRAKPFAVPAIHYHRVLRSIRERHKAELELALRNMAIKIAQETEPTEDLTN